MVKNKIRRVARSAALSVFGTAAATAKGPFLRALYFHGVASEHAGNFAANLERLKRNADFVDTASLLAMLGGQKAVAGRYFHLSFDDGHRNLIENALPVLEQLGIPALFFVCTSWVGAKQDALSWEDLRELRNRGFEIGSHTRSHKNLGGALTREVLDGEVLGSKRDIEMNLKAQCNYFAWPFGRKKDINDVALQAIRQAGYRACFGAFRGSVFAGRTSPFQIPRHHLEADWPWKHVRFFAEGHGEE
jgi:peptidoglycan/xylan/chitin deacetylase (PgdA/CDA1 family)